MKTKISLTQMLAGLVLLSAPVLGTATVNGADLTNSQNILGQFQKLEKLTEKERDALLREADRNLHQLEEALLTKLVSENQDVRFYAAYLLGQYRFPRAADSLAQNITMEDDVRSTMLRSPEWFWDRYPAAEALVKIGEPSIPSVIRNLSESDNSKIRELSLKVLCCVEKDQDIVKLRLQKAATLQPHQEKKARLDAALRTLLDPSPSSK